MTLDYAEHLVTASRRSSDQRRDATGRLGDAQAETHRVVREPSRPLDSAIRAEMEGRFGHDFGSVRVHADETAAASARTLDASAYSLGSDLVFGAGQYAPETRAGKLLLAHELAHVVQQNESTACGDTSSRDDTQDTALLESDARHAAEAAVNGRSAAVRGRARAARPLRQAAAPAAEAPAKPARPRREERFNVGRHRKPLDAELDRAAGWLTVKMKLKFEPVDSPMPWPSPARFAQFQTEFIEMVARRWNFKHYLVPATPCPDEPQLVAVRVQIVPVSSGQHATVRVKYTSSWIRSSVGTGVANLDVLDVEPSGFVPQREGEHEFGHLLGLPHVHCPTNEPECYGTTSSEKADVMGLGSYVSPRDYEPFAEIMRYFTGCNYNVRQASNIPTSRGPDIGAGVGLVAGGALGALVGSLFGPLGAAVGGVLGAVGGFFLGRLLGTPEIPS